MEENNTQEPIDIEEGEYECTYYGTSPIGGLKLKNRCIVKLSPKTLKIALLEPCRAIYGVECEAFENGNVRIPLYPQKTARGIKHSPHHVEVWSEKDFTVYFYRAGIPTYFKKIDEKTTK